MKIAFIEVVSDINMSWVPSTTYALMQHDINKTEHACSLLRIFDEDLYHLEHLEDFFDLLKSESYDIIAYSSEFHRFLGGLIRSALPSAQILVGGPSALDIIGHGNFDLLIDGPARTAVVHLLDALSKGGAPEDLDQVANLFYRKDGLINSSQKQVKYDVETEMFPFTPDYTCRRFGRAARDVTIIRASLVASIGCPYNHPISKNPLYADVDIAHASLVADIPMTPEAKQIIVAKRQRSKNGCSFCNIKSNKQFSTFAQDNISERLTQQMEAILAEVPTVTTFIIIDENVFRFLVPFVQHITEKKLPSCTFVISSRSDYLVHGKEQLWKALASLRSTGHVISLGCVGFENFSQHELDILNKGIAATDNISAIEILRETKKRFGEAFLYKQDKDHGFILFTPWTSMDDLQHNIAIIKKYELYDVTLPHILVNEVAIFPGRSIYYKAQQDGLLIDSGDEKRTYCLWKFQDARVQKIHDALQEYISQHSDHESNPSAANGKSLIACIEDAMSTSISEVESSELTAKQSSVKNTKRIVFVETANGSDELVPSISYALFKSDAASLGYSCDVLIVHEDIRSDDAIREEFLANLNKGQYDIIALPSYFYIWFRKHITTEAKLLIGGNVVSDCLDERIDFAIEGYARASLRKLLQAFASGSSYADSYADIPQLYYRMKDGSLAHNDITLAPDLKEEILPYTPDFETKFVGFDHEMHYASAHIITSLGCSYHQTIADNPFFADLYDSVSDASASTLCYSHKGCSFCLVSKNGFSMLPQLETVKLAVQQIKAIRSSLPHVKKITIIDEQPLRFLDALVEELTKQTEEIDCNDLEIAFNCRSDDLLASWKQLERAIMHASKQDGHMLINLSAVGFENFSQHELDIFNKGISPEQNEAALVLMRDLKRRFPDHFVFDKDGGSGFILFNPWTTIQDVIINLKAVHRLGLLSLFAKKRYLGIQLSIFKDTPVYLKAKHDGVLLEDAESDFGEIRWKFLDVNVEELFDAFHAYEKTIRHLKGSSAYLEKQFSFLSRTALRKANDLGIDTTNL